MVNIIFIYMHICKCIQYTHDDDVASLCKKVLYLMIEELHHQVQLCDISYNCAYFKHLVLMRRKIDDLNYFLHLLRYLLICKVSYGKYVQLIVVS